MGSDTVRTTEHRDRLVAAVNCVGPASRGVGVVVFLGCLLRWRQRDLVLILRRELDERRKGLERRFVGL